jgi:ribose 5-phosphate isomerase B
LCSLLNYLIIRTLGFHVAQYIFDPLTVIMKLIHIGADHAGFELKEAVKDYCNQNRLAVVDHGTFSPESTDYPDYAHKVALGVLQDNALGILICGSANGVCITANKHQGIRAALCWNEEITVLARQHNDANVLCLPARYITTVLALRMVDLFISTLFEGGRHQNRVSKIDI